ncbi:hypothetical protein [Morganella morganii]|uniref:hypothetical protein n=1 Tax=Morganella morganii TaxID=582 RepID=UPI0037510B55
MMIIDYPDWLPLAQKPDKNMTIDTGYMTDQPQVGAPIFQKLTDDLKTVWNVTWIFTLVQERAFAQWLRHPDYLDNCNRWFRMKIDIGGSGLEEQELHFVSYPVQTSVNGASVTWAGQVICKNLHNDDDEFGDVIIEFPPPFGSWLDVIVTETLPRCKEG